MQAQKSLSNISANRELWLAQYRQEVKERDWRSGMVAVERRCIARGRAAGRAEGLTEGRLTAYLDLVKSGVFSLEVAEELQRHGLHRKR